MGSVRIDEQGIDTYTFKHRQPARLNVLLAGLSPLIAKQNIHAGLKQSGASLLSGGGGIEYKSWTFQANLAPITSELPFVLDHSFGVGAVRRKQWSTK